MFNPKRSAKVNVKALVVLILVTVAIASSLFAAREVRRNILSKMDLDTGQTAFEKEDWATAAKSFQRYLSRNPGDLDVLQKYAKACLATRPLDAESVSRAMAAYRRIIQLAPLDEVAYEKLAELYAGTGNFEELAYIADIRLTQVPADRKAPLWKAEALIRLRKLDEARRVLDSFINQIEALPNMPAEYVKACSLMSQVLMSGPASLGTQELALKYLTKAVEACPQSVEALAQRARFYRQTTEIPGIAEQDRLTLAQKDLEAADALDTDDPRIRLFLAAEWLEHGELDRTAAELKAVENLPQETIEQQFLDLRDWTVARFLFASQLATRRKATAEGISLADEVLSALTETRHRVRVLPSAVMLYLAGGKVAEARQCLDEYVKTMYAQEGAAESKLGLAYLKALVARAEDRPYLVIDVLQPAVVMDASRPELWRLLAEAFGRTDQTRRAIGAIVKYLRLRPNDPEMTLQLAKEYLRLRDWNRAFETARLGEPMDPTDIIIRLLRIEASMYQAAQQSYQPDPSSFESLSAELAQLRKDHPDRVDIRILQAVIAGYLQKPDEAKRLLQEAIEQCPEPLQAEMQLARFYYRAKRITEAISTCRAACDRHPEVAEPWLSLSGLYAAEADYVSAQDALTRGLKSVTSQSERRSLSIQLALLGILHGDRAAGIRLLGELASKDQQDIYVRSLLLGMREIRDDRPTAERLLGELRAAEGESGLFWRLYQASLWLSSEDWRSRQPQITDALQYCIDSDPEWSVPALLMAEMYEKLDDVRRAEDVCRQALLRNPSAADVADKLLILLEQSGRLAETQQVLQQVQVDARTTNALRVRAALREGDFSRAIDELKVRVSNDDRDAGSRIQLARLLYQRDTDANEAFKYLNEAEAITPDSQTLIAVRASILRAEGQAQQARQILDDHVADSNDFNAYWMRAVYLAEEGQFKQAEQDFRKLITFHDKGAAGYSLLANFYLNNKQPDEAAAVLQEGANLFPADMRLKRELMKILLRGADPKDRSRGMEIFAKLEEQSPQDPELMKLRALQLLQEPTPESSKAARQKLEDVVRLEPTAADAHLALIGMAMQEGDYRTARDLAIRAVGSNPNNLALLSARASAEFKLGNMQMAIELSRLVLQQEPANSEALSTALQCKDRSLIEEVRSLVDSAAAVNPEDERLLLSRARVLVALEQPQTAISLLEAHCQQKQAKADLSIQVTLADLYRLTGEMDKARQKIEQAEQIDPKNLTVIHARFLWLLAQKRFDELAQISSAYLSARERNPTTLATAASILAALDSVELKKAAVPLFERAVTLAPMLKEARLGLASGLYQTGEKDRAVTIYQELLRQYPNDTQVLNDLAWIRQEHEGAYDEALVLADRGLTLWPNELHLLDTRGTILLKMNRLVDARKDFEKLAELAPPNGRQKAGTLLNLGRTCEKLNDPAQAKRYLQDALEIDRKTNVLTPDERSEITKILQAGGVQAADK